MSKDQKEIEILIYIVEKEAREERKNLKNKKNNRLKKKFI